MNLDVSVNRQTGSYDNRAISAYQAFAAQTFALGAVTPTAPRLGWRADFGSGGGAFGTGKLRNANVLFGTAPYFSYGTFLGPSNFLDIAPTFSFTPVKSVRALAEVAFVWRNDERDAVYSGVGGAYLGTQNVSGHSVAQLARMMTTWTATTHLSFTIRAEYLRADRVLTRAGYSDALFTGVWTTIRF